MPEIIAIDFETYYDDAYSVASLGAVGYVQDPRFRVYLVSIYGAGIEYVGPLLDAPWEKINGLHWWSHNALFDRAVFEEYFVCGAPAEPCYWDCTANFAAYRQVGRSLKVAAKELLGIKVSKSYRDIARGKVLEDFDDQEREQVIAAGLQDAKACHALAEMAMREWPEREFEASRMTIESALEGIQVDWKQVDGDLARLRKARQAAEDMIPWAKKCPTCHGSGKVWNEQTGRDNMCKVCKGDTPGPLSRSAFNAYCRQQGIEPPKSVAKGSDEFAEWVAKHDAPWVKAVQHYRSANTFVQKYKSLKRLRARGDVIPAYTRYYGAEITGRWGGSTHDDHGDKMSSVNLQNLPDPTRVNLYGADMRGCLVPRPGHVFIIGDLSQIEPRVLAWLAQDTEFLKLVKTMSPYEAHARVSMGWEGGELKKENPAMYSLAKARILALGYGAGYAKFITMCRSWGMDPEAMFGTDPDPKLEREFLEWVEAYQPRTFKDEAEITLSARAWKQVNDFRDSNPKVTALWKELDTELKDSVREDPPAYSIGLPSGRYLHYRDLRRGSKGGVSAKPVAGVPRRKYYYGGLLTENLVQATARDVFLEACIRVRKAGYPILWTVHDELISEVPAGEGDLAVRDIDRLMSVTPDWMPGLPVAADVHEATQYGKE